MCYVLSFAAGVYVGKYGTSHLVALWKALVAKFKKKNTPTPSVTPTNPTK